MKPKILVLVGPTSSGKSALAVELAKRFGGEVISADSRQVYRGLDIGTGKITKREMKGIAHHLLDVASPKRAFTANDYVRRARKVVREISARGKLPIIAGGTGFYIDALVGRVVLPDVPPDPGLRKKLGKKSAAQLFSMLKKKDPRRARAMDTQSERNNKVRLIRALEIAAGRGMKKAPAFPPLPPLDPLWIGMTLQSKVIHKKIHNRLMGRIKKGMVAEAKRLHKEGLAYKRMEALGLEYRSLARLLQKKTSIAAMTLELQHAIRRYAKSQLRYWKRNKDIRWFKTGNRPRMAALVRSWLRER